MNWWWLFVLYPIPLLLTIRQVRHGMQNWVDRNNEERKSVLSAWQTIHKGHEQNSRQDYCYSCQLHAEIPEHYTYRERWGGDGYDAKPFFAGVFWPVFIPGYAFCRVWQAVHFGIQPALDWFWENPKHRKQRKLGAT